MDLETVLNEVSENMKKGIDKISDAISQSQLFTKYKDSDDAIADMLDDAGKVVTGVMDSLSDQVEPFIQNTKKKVYDSFYADYKKAGEPYGSTHEGFMKWTDEREDQVRERVNKETTRVRGAVNDGFQKAKETIERELKNTQPDDTADTPVETDQNEKPSDR